MARTPGHKAVVVPAVQGDPVGADLREGVEAARAAVAAPAADLAAVALEARVDLAAVSAIRDASTR